MTIGARISKMILLNFSFHGILHQTSCSHTS